MKTLTVSSRIVGGFSLLLAITLILGGFAAWRMEQAGETATVLAQAVAPQAEITSNLAQASAKVQLAARTYGLTGDKASLEAASAALGLVETDLEEARKLAVAQPSLTALAAGIKESTAALAEYRRQFDATRLNLENLARIRETLDARATEFVRAIERYIAEQNESLAKEITAGLAADKVEERRWKIEQGNLILATGNAIRIANFKSQALRNSEFIEQAEPRFAEIDRILKALLPVTRTESQRANLTKVDEAARAYREGVQAQIANAAEALEIQKARTVAAGRFDTAVAAVLDVSIQKTTRFSTESAASLSHTTWMVLVGAGLAVVTGIVASFLIVHSLNRKLRETSSTVTQGAIQIAAASGQVSSTSQGLAEGASEQAASLEEISSSLEELASTTRNNAQSANSAKASADAARTAAEHGAAEMKKMEEAMTGIRQSSSDISKIIKTIDEIAFQTNILALNAAVEAARAGEAGAGFAVVADEVRTLAQRCAIAAKETTEKISDATTRSEQGAALSSSVSQSLGEIVGKARDVDRLVADVARASQEQSVGIEQVNIAVTQMDKVTQANAASAEEAASAAEELNAQSAELRHASEELAALVGLRTTSADTPVAAGPTRRPALASKRPVLAGSSPAQKVSEKDFVEAFQ